MDKFDASLSRTLTLINEHFSLARYTGFKKAKALLDVRYAAKGIIKIMQSLLTTSDVNPELVDPLCNICHFIALKVTELNTQQIDEDVVVYLLQILKGQRSDEPRIRKLIGALAAYASKKNFQPKDVKFLETLILFIVSMEYFSSAHPEVCNLLSLLEELLVRLRSTNVIVFDSQYLFRAKRCGFLPHMMRYALRSLGSSSKQVMSFVLTLKPWLEDYGGFKWEPENIGRSYMGLKRMRETFLVRTQQDVEMVLQFQRSIEELMPLPFRSLKLKDSFVNSIAKCLNGLDETDFIYTFIVQELCAILGSENPDQFTGISTGAVAGLLHGIGKKKNWYEPCSRSFVHALCRTWANGHWPLKAATIPETCRLCCVMMSSFEQAANLYPDLLSVLKTLMQAIISCSKLNYKLTPTDLQFVFKGVASFILAEKTPALANDLDLLVGDVLDSKAAGADQLMQIAMTEGMHFYLQRIQNEKLNHKHVFNLLSNITNQCQALSTIIPLLDLLPLIDVNGQHVNCQAIVAQLHHIVKQGPVAEGILYNLGITHYDADISNKSEDSLLSAVITNCNMYRSLVPIPLAQMAAHILCQICSVSGPWQKMRDLVCVLMNYVLMYVADESCPSEWRDCMAFCTNYKTKSHYIASLGKVVNHLQDELMRKSVRHLETLFGSFCNQNMSRQAHPVTGQDDIVPYSLTLEQLLLSNSTKLLVECIVACSKSDVAQRLPYETEGLRNIYNNFYYGAFRLPESMWYTIGNPKYTAPIAVPWRNVEERAVNYVKQQLMLGKNTIAWHSTMSYCLVHGLPAAICIELAPMVAPVVAPADGDILFLTQPTGAANNDDSLWLLIDILPKNRLVTSAYAQFVMDAAAIRDNLNIVYAAVLLDATLSTNSDDEAVKADNTLHRYMEGILDKLLAAFGLCGNNTNTKG